MKTINTIAYAVMTLAIPLALFAIPTAHAQDYGYDFGDFSGIGDSYDYSFGNSGYDYSTGGDSYGYGYDFSDYTGIGDSYDYTSYDYDYNFDDYTGIGDAYDYSAYDYDYNFDDYTGIGDAYDYGDYYDVNAGGDYAFDTDGNYIDANVAGDMYDVIDTNVGGDLAYVYPDYTDYPYYSDYSYPYTYGNTDYNYYTSPYTYSYTGGYTYTYPTYDSPNYPTYQDPTCTLTVRPSTIDEDDDATLTWTTSRATSVSINNGVGTVGRNGSREVSPDSTRTYTLVATGPGGSTWCTATVVVDEDDEDEDEDDVSCDSFTASDTNVDDGDYVTLRWRTTNADDVDIDEGIGDVDEDGDERVRITDDTTFTLIARNGSDTDTCRVTVRVDEDEDDDDDDNNSRAPRCIFNISDTTAYSGQPIILSWTTERTDRLVLRDSSRTILDSDDNRNVNEDRGGITVTPTESTTYTLTVYNGNVRRTCELGVTVGPRTGISLSQVPYTGFDAGPMLTALFYGAIALWGLFIAYVLVIKKKTKQRIQ